MRAGSSDCGNSAPSTAFVTFAWRMDSSLSLRRCATCAASPIVAPIASAGINRRGNRAPFLLGTHTDYYSSKYTAAPSATPRQRQEAIEEFIDYALSPEAQAAFTEAMFYAPTNSKAASKISEKAISRTAAGSMDKMIDINWLDVAKIRDAITEQWRRRVIPLSR